VVKMGGMPRAIIYDDNIIEIKVDLCSRKQKLNENAVL